VSNTGSTSLNRSFSDLTSSDGLQLPRPLVQPPPFRITSQRCNSFFSLRLPESHTSLPHSEQTFENRGSERSSQFDVLRVWRKPNQSEFAHSQIKIISLSSRSHSSASLLNLDNRESTDFFEPEIALPRKEQNHENRRTRWSDWIENSQHPK
jgi:hypothetical protein